MASLFASEIAGSTGVHEVQSIRFIGADTAIVVSKSAMELADQTEPDPAGRALDTWVLARSAEGWLVHAFASSLETAAE